ncbi:MAG TPA: helix-turn-helix domain-containing protein [Streptosporangiaceae bacterium]
MSSEATPAKPETGSESRVQIELTDPKAMRAISHPLRMALLDIIEVTGTLTATQASEILGESPANCAFHLRTLGKYGFIAEAGGGKGRERPWKRVNSRINLSSRQETPSAALTARMTQQMWFDRVIQRARQFLGSDERPEGWHDAETASKTIQFLTAAEMTQLNDDVRQLLHRYDERQSDPAKRPEGSLPVEILYFAYPLADLADLAAKAESGGE